MQLVESLINRMNELLWGSLLVYLLVGCGIYFTLRTRFVQLRRFTLLWRLLLHSRENSHGGISSFQAFCVGLASRVGTGNIAGVALAITLGGPGAVFWMWCTGLIGMATAFVEATLAQIYKVPQPDGTFRGGPAFYIERGLGQKWLGTLFSLLLVFCFGIAFNAVQANAISDVLGNAHNIEPHVTGIILVVLTLPVIFGGIRSVSRVAEWLLPVMALAYIAMALVIMFRHPDRFPDVFRMIFQSAFGVHQAAAGITGGIAAAMLNGVKRGLFSNEAGMGSAPNTAATATTPHPAVQGFVQSLGVFVDTMITCTATAFIILMSGLCNPDGTSVAGASLTQAAVAQEFGRTGELFMTVIVFMFAFSSILGNYAYAEVNLTFLKADSRVLMAFRAVSLGSVLAGTIVALPLVWSFADVAMGLLALINLTAILLLSRWATGALRDYDAALDSGEQPVFTADGNKYLPGVLKSDVW